MLTTSNGHLAVDREELESTSLNLKNTPLLFAGDATGGDKGCETWVKSVGGVGCRWSCS